ncbi:hypothetical protein B9057_13560 [Aestuarium zhoushanense]|nr:hypothetical protein B9057_13560 [Aestuarium zhoushanense]
MSAAPVSVIVVSRDRPQHLRRCVKGLMQLLHPNFEIIVVADQRGCEEMAAGGFAKSVKLIPFDEANIAAARNAGLEVAAGTIVAFIDDDAIPEPTWLDHLVGPIASRQAVAAGGYVRGRNGISFQWKARDVRPNGWSEELLLDSDDPICVEGSAQQGIKTEGTNMAFDRDVLCKLGGFDPAFQFYLDETDLNMRLAGLEMTTAIVPRAQVHHGFAASDKRREDRAPTTLFPIGRSLKVFLRKHLPEAKHGPVIDSEVKAQGRRLIEHMIAGRIEPKDVSVLMATMTQGLLEGETANIAPLAPISPSKEPFLKFEKEVADAGHMALVGRWYSWSRVKAAARMAREEGYRVTVFRYSLTALFHHVRFQEDGIWLQRGGLFGRSDRSDPMFRLWTKKSRTAHEMSRLAGIRDKFP